MISALVTASSVVGAVKSWAGSGASVFQVRGSWAGEAHIAESANATALTGDGRSAVRSRAVKETGAGRIDRVALGVVAKVVETTPAAQKERVLEF